MREIEKEAREVVDSATPSPAVYLLIKSYDGGLRLSKKESITFSKNSVITPIAVHVVREFLNIEGKCHFIDKSSIALDEFVIQIRLNIRSIILNYLKNHLDSKSVKTTSMYRWYSEFLSTNRLRDNEQMDNDYFNIYKWIKSSDTLPVREDVAKAVISVLEVLKQRYEAQGMKL